MPPDLLQPWLGDAPWLGPAAAGATFLASLIVAAIVHKLIIPLALRMAARTPTQLDHHLITGLRWHVTWGIAALGLYLGLTYSLELDPGLQNIVDGTFATIAAILVVTALTGVVSRLIDWYLESLAGKGLMGLPGLDPRLFPLFRRVVVFLIYGLGGLLILDLLSININPLIAGLGLGGLAVALAVQPTLSNLFAGTYVMTEGVISTGDYVEMEGGISGYVVGVGWRSTRIRTWGNNLVVIPNARFADTIITNYGEPTPAVNVYLTCGVSYDSDLNRVEAVSREAMQEVLDSDPNAVQEYGAWFAYDSFGDSNVNFWLFAQARDRLASFELQSALIRNVHRRFEEEGIVINYPVRTLQFPPAGSPVSSPLEHDRRIPWSSAPPAGVHPAEQEPPAAAGAPDGPGAP